MTIDSSVEPFTDQQHKSPNTSVVVIVPQKKKTEVVQSNKSGLDSSSQGCGHHQEL
ncbi:hypothetical protein CROQUDRAFT_99157 [Cronartium quercuum f. sp. fusiforme G11]|uniref:Uncharacterized protein n=1 Tax=Cronartium quercuum f. sp. fusiforme G11 TaxID=708437 RepID=A0A9P6N7K1_9BASI|nr:hypothetical protein CROQUDRAFT_99157 [Cronartium quercuum f. sp. fusiforme G11]